MEILQENWIAIKKRVVVPLWNKRFRSMYESIKMDYNDFESLAGYELTKAMATFNPEKSNLFTYASNVINKKAMTELRNCTQRDVRKTLYVSESVDALDNSIVENISCDKFCDNETSKDDLSDKMQRYLNRLSKLQKQILFALSEGYTNDEIIERFNITPKEMCDAYTAIKSYRNVSILY